MTGTSKSARFWSGVQAALVTGGVAWQVVAHDTRDHSPKPARNRNENIELQIREQTREDLLQDYKDWRELELERERTQSRELGYQLREPEYREERERHR